nr:conserved hypothetical protein [Hymenolepis microstoma]
MVRRELDGSRLAAVSPNSEIMTDTLSSTNSTNLYRSPYPNRHPKLGISAVLRSASVSPLSSSQAKPLDSPLRLDDPPSVTCRFRPGLRPVRIIDMANFRLKRKQLGKSAGLDGKDNEIRRSSTLLLQSRRQPLKAFQQNTLPPNISTFNFKQQDSHLTVRDTSQIQGQPTTNTSIQRISTNPKIRRYSSSDMATSKQYKDGSFDEHVFVEVENGLSRKRKSVPVRPSKKLKSRDSLDSVNSNIISARGTHSPASTPTSTMTNSATTKQNPKTGVMTRIRSQTQLAYEAVKRVVRRHSKRRSDSYELRRDTEIY